MKCSVVISLQKMECPKHPSLTVGKGRRDYIQLASQKEAFLAQHQTLSILLETLLVSGGLLSKDSYGKIVGDQRDHGYLGIFGSYGVFLTLLH